MKLKPFTEHKLFKPALGAVLAIAAGVALWATPFGETWRDASYDFLYLCTTRHATNPPVVVIFMDKEAYADTGQSRDRVWDRARHARLFDRLFADGCPLVVIDVFFEDAGGQPADEQLAESMRRMSNVVLMSWHDDVFKAPNARQLGIVGAGPLLPLKLFVEAVGETNCAVGGVRLGLDGVVRQHWRFPSPGHYESLAWTAAKLAGARLSDVPEERWVRYYAPGAAWVSLSYLKAEAQRANFFHDKIVFIGKHSEVIVPGLKDEFATPYTVQTGALVGGVEIHATEFLNLVNHEWLRRPPAWVEMLVLVITGALLGGGLCRRGKVLACLLAMGAMFIALVAGVCLAHYTRFWFPWLIVTGCQVPVALVFALVWRARTSPAISSTIIVPRPEPENPPPDAIEDQFDPPDYGLVRPPFGRGAFGLVWLARNAVGQWQAVKSIHRSKFGEDASPYEREFQGLQLYQSVSHNHPGLLRIDFVSRMKPEDYFYYVMELGDAVTPGWEQDPTVYKPLDLATKCEANNGRLPVRECVRIGAQLCEPLQFLHENGLTHRDIKPRNIIFVKAQPKLADVGLVSAAHRPSEEMTGRGTMGFMPPAPEPPDTPQADIYGLGMTLYVISTGNKPALFPELSSTLVDRNRHPEFNRLSEIFFKACQPDRALRYATVTEMHAALLKI